jgi:hypothetical protein
MGMAYPSLQQRDLELVKMKGGNVKEKGRSPAAK